MGYVGDNGLKVLLSMIKDSQPLSGYDIIDFRSGSVPRLEKFVNGVGTISRTYGIPHEGISDAILTVEMSPIHPVTSVKIVDGKIQLFVQELITDGTTIKAQPFTGEISITRCYGFIKYI